MRFGWFALFLAVFLSLYGGMHYYIYKKAAPLLPAAHVYVAWVFALLVMSPILIQLMINANWIGLARVVAGARQEPHPPPGRGSPARRVAATVGAGRSGSPLAPERDRHRHRRVTERP